MRLSIVTDEISSDLETALELAAQWGVDGIELRGVGAARYPDVSEFWRARVPELIAAWGIPVAALSPGLFKLPLAVEQSAETKLLRWEDLSYRQRRTELESVLRHHSEVLLPEAIEAAASLGCTTIVAFSFERGPAPIGSGLPPEGMRILRQAAAAVERAGLTLAIETEHVCYGDTPARTAEIVRALHCDAVGVNWDPANVFRAGCDAPFPDGYAAVRDVVRHVHFKQASVADDGARGFSATGVIDWKGQIDALAADGYDGWISVEPHVGPKVAQASAAVMELRTLLGGQQR